MKKRIEELEAELSSVRQELDWVRAQSELWRLMACEAPDYLAIVDEDKRYIWTNRCHPALSPKDVIGASLHEFLAPEDCEAAYSSIDAALRSGEPTHYAVRSLVGEEESWYEVRVVPLEHRRVLLASRDITRQKQAERSLQESERIAMYLVENYPDVILIVKADGTVVATNEATARLLGTTRDELIGTDAFAHMPLDVEVRRRGFLREVVETGQAIRREDNNGGRVFDTIAFALDAPGDPVTRIAIVSRDVTESRRAEEFLREREARHWHSEKMEALGTLAAGIAHDFNNALTPIIVNAQLAGRTNVTAERRAQLLEQIHQAARHAAGLVRQILAYGRTDHEVHRIDVRAMLLELEGLVRASLPPRIEIILDLPDEAGCVRGDETRLQQALINLCINAGQAIGEARGRLTIAVKRTVIERSSDGPPELLPGHYHVLSVSDTGAGISAELRDRIFDPFFSTKPADQGSGLGLFVVHGVARNHRGTVTVESVPGAGSTFAMWLPSASEGLEVSSPVIPLPRVAEPLRVLLVDDEPQILRAAADILMHEGHQVTTATSATEARAILRGSIPFDAAIFDQRLGDGSGIELAAELRANRSRLPIALCSGLVTVAHRSRCEQLGVPILNKPFEPVDLVAMLARLAESA